MSRGKLESGNHRGFNGKEFCLQVWEAGLSESRGPPLQLCSSGPLSAVPWPSSLFPGSAVSKNDTIQAAYRRRDSPAADTTREVVDRWLLDGALFGIESFHQDILKQMHKNEKVQAAFELAQKLNRAGLYSQGYYIIGLPPETPESIAEDLRTLASLELDTTQITIVTPHPQTEMWRELESRFGILEKDWSKFDTKQLVWNHPHCAPGVLESLLEQGFRGCYGNGWLKRTSKKFLATRRIQRDFSSILMGPVRARLASPHRLRYLPPHETVSAEAQAHAASA